MPSVVKRIFKASCGVDETAMDSISMVYWRTSLAATKVQDLKYQNFMVPEAPGPTPAR